MPKWRLSWPRRSREAQRGSLIVTTFVIIVGLTMVLGGVNVLLKQQMETSLAIKKLSLGRLQAFYLAEMGVNEFMARANYSGGAQPVAETYDLTNYVAMTKGGKGTATCTIENLGGGKFRAKPALSTTADGPFDIPFIITFTPAWDATDRVWELASYEVKHQP